ncbi:MAG: DUF1028 domain-containing protein [Alphaproteobacteria bacterium]
MTLSIVAMCPRSGQFGIAAATAMPAVGKLLTHAAAGQGAIATQARINPYLGIDGLDLLRRGLSADAVLARLADGDPRYDLRQVAVVDRRGAAAVWTGPGCPAYSGAVTRDGFAAQGNRLEGPRVLEAMAATFAAAPAHPLARRLVDALAAGITAGGDRKEERSATIYVVEEEAYPLWDIRVDEHSDPVAELVRLHGVFAAQVVPQIRRMPTRAHPAGLPGEAVA